MFGLQLGIFFYIYCFFGKQRQKKIAAAAAAAALSPLSRVAVCCDPSQDNVEVGRRFGEAAIDRVEVVGDSQARRGIRRHEDGVR